MSLVAEMASAVTGSSDHGRNGGSTIEIGANGAGPIVVPDHVFLLTAGFDRHGSDLHLTHGDKAVVLKGYFAPGGTPVDLTTTSGATVTGQTAKILAGSPAFVQLAQAAGGAAGPAAIGKVTALTGDVQVIRAGVALASTGPDKVAIDTPIYRNDVLVTGKDSSVGVTFVDKTNFSLGADARMAMNEFAFNPQNGTGHALLSVLQGSFSFVSGQVAKTGPDAIKVQMPTMTIGIRGTTVAGYASAEGSESQVTLLKNSDGTVGAIFVNNSQDGFLLNQANFTLYSSSYTQAMQQPALLVNLTKYQDALSTLQKAITNSGTGKEASLDKSPADLALAKALADIQTAGGENANSGSGSGGYSILNLGSLTLVTFRAGGDIFAALFNNTDFNRANGGTGSSNTATTPPIVNEQPATTSATDPVVVQVTEDMAGGGTIPGPTGGSPGSLTFTLVVPPNFGNVVVQADGTFVYTPGLVLQGLAQGQVQQDTFTVQITGGPGGTINQVITVDVTGVNDAPVATNDFGVTGQDAVLTGNVLGNDTDVDTVLQQPLAVSLVNGAAGNVGQAIGSEYGSVTLNADGSYTFTPNQNAQALAEGETATVTVTYQVVDEFGATSNATLTITINGANDAPTAVAAVGAVVEDGATLASGNLLAGAGDIDHGDSVSLAAVNGIPLTSGSEGSGGSIQIDSSYGTLSVGADGHYDFLLNNNSPDVQALAQGETHDLAYTYTVTDEHGALTTSTLTITVTGTNDAPVATATTGAVVEDGQATAQGNVITGHVTDVDHGSVLKIVSVDGQPMGSGDGGQGGGTLELSQTVQHYLNGQGNSLVNGLGGAQGFGENIVAVGDDNSTGAIDISSVFTGGLNFFGHNYTQLFVNNNGNVTFGQSLGTYTPSSIGSGVNFPIIAPFWADVDTNGGDTAATPGGTSTGSNNVYYDLDTTNHVFTVTWDDVGYYGSHTDKADAFQLQLVDRGNGDFDIVFRYESINWTTGDASGGSGGLGGSPARAGYNAGDGQHSAELPGSGNQSSVLSYDTQTGNTGEIGVFIFQVRGGQVVGNSGTVVIDGTYGTLTMHADGSYTYALHNDAAAVQALAQGETAHDVFNYVVADEHGAPAASTLTIDVAGTNDAPIAHDDANGANENGGDQIVEGYVLANDTDVDHNSLLSVVAASAAGGNAALAGDGGGWHVHGQYGTLYIGADGHYTYVLDEGSQAVQALAEGEQVHDVFSYTVADEHGAQDTAALDITVTGANTGPTAMADAIQAAEDGGPVATAIATLLANDSDPDGTVTLASVDATSAAGAAVTIDDGNVVYDPGQLFQSLAQGESTTDTFTYTIEDNDGAGSTATVTVTVTGTNDAPVAIATTGAVAEDGATQAAGGNLLSNASDVDHNSVLSIASVNGIALLAGAEGGVHIDTAYGSLTVQADGGYSYVLNNGAPGVQALGAGETQDDVFTYQVTDEHGATAETTLTITIAGANDAPVAEGDRIVSVSDDSGPVALHIAAATDADAHDVLAALITGLPANGTLTLANGDAVANGQSLTMDQLTGLVFHPGQGGESASSAFSYTVTDGHGGSDSATITFNTEPATHDPRIGYYDMVLGEGNANQLPSILADGFTAINVTEPNAAQLAGIDVLYVQNPLNAGYGGEYLSQLTDIANAVANGMTLIISDRHINSAETILPGGDTFDIVRNFDDASDINVLDPNTLLTNGPGGTVTNMTLDGGSFSSHGFAFQGSLPGNADLLLSTGDASHIVAFSYAYGEGHVFYSSIPLDYYLGGGGPDELNEAFQNIYAPNLVAYGADLAELATGHQFTGGTGNDILIGGLGNDLLVGGGGRDLLLASAGDDRLVVKDTGFAKADGGAGNDVLAFDMDGTIDLSGLSGDRFAGIEKLDLTNGKGNTLVIGADQVLALNSEHQGADNTADNALKVLGDAGDTVKLVGDWVASGPDSAGAGFQLYTLNDAKVAVEQQDLTVQIIH